MSWERLIWRAWSWWDQKKEELWIWWDRRSTWRK